MKLGLALGGGGARGSAHIGALDELLRIGLRPDVIAGTSIGAFIGAMIAAGFNIPQIEHAMRSLKPSAMYALPDKVPAVAATDNLERYLLKVFTEHFGERLTQRQNPRPVFADLQIPLAVVTADLVNRREVVLDEGDLVRAILASMSIPVLFPPVHYGEKRLVDGGLMNNLPLDVARARGAIYTIAIDLGNAAPYGTLSETREREHDRNLLGIRWDHLIDGGNFFDRALFQATRDPLWQVVTAVMDIVNQQNVALRLAFSPPDVLLRPEMGTLGVLDFHQIDEGIEAGRQSVYRAAPQIERLLTQLARYRTLPAGTE